ncbi:MAG: hypothetical protein QMD77_01440 [Patescibacteria group bacterium]|nr:hypothetical protein [Patescibacteria group bacterium]
MVEKMGEGSANLDSQKRKFEVVPAQEGMGAKNCLVINDGVVLTVFEVVQRACSNRAVVNRGEEDERYVVQFPGCEQEELTYGEIHVKLKNSALSGI